MADVYIRNMDAHIVSKLDELAEKRNMSRNKFVIGILTNYALASEVKEIDSRYQELFKIVIDAMEGNSHLLHEILMKMEKDENAKERI